MSQEELAQAATAALIPLMVEGTTPRKAADAVLAITEADKAKAVAQARWEALDEVLSAVNRIPRNEATRAWLEAETAVTAPTEEKS